MLETGKNGGNEGVKPPDVFTVPKKQKSSAPVVPTSLLSGDLRSADQAFQLPVG